MIDVEMLLMGTDSYYNFRTVLLVADQIQSSK